MGSDIDPIRANCQAYETAALRITDDAKRGLRRDLRIKLTQCLQLKNPDDLTPDYVPDLTATSMLYVGLTESAVAYVQAWLLAHSPSFKPKVPKERHGARVAVRAALMPDAFGFDVKEAQAALSEIDLSESAI